MRNFDRMIDGKPFDKKGAEIKACIKHVSDGGRSVALHDCGRKLKGDAEYPYLCGMHVSVLRRGQDKYAVRNARKLELAAADLDIERRAKAVSVALGTELQPGWHYPTKGPNAHIGHLTGKVEVELSFLEGLAAELVRLKAIVDEL
jgi:hypothetical protein